MAQSDGAVWAIGKPLIKKITPSKVQLLEDKIKDIGMWTSIETILSC